MIEPSTYGLLLPRDCSCSLSLASFFFLLSTSSFFFLPLALFLVPRGL